MKIYEEVSLYKVFDKLGLTHTECIDRKRKACGL